MCSQQASIFNCKDEPINLTDYQDFERMFISDGTIHRL